MIEHFKKIISEKSDEEIVKIFHNSNEYQKDFVDLIELEIKKRGLSVEFITTISSKEEQIKIEKLKKGNKGDHKWFYIGITLSFFGGLIPLIIGYNYLNNKIYYNGTSYFYYNEGTRKQGKFLIVIGIIILLITIILFNKYYLNY